MSDLISRQGAIDILCKHCGITEKVEKCRKESADGWCIEYFDLKNMPTVEAIPVEWIKKFTEESKRHIQGSVNNYTYMYDYMLSEWKQRKEE